MTVVVGITLMLVAALLVASNLQAWRTADHGGLGAAEREFHARRFRRRVQASALVGVVGLLILGDLLLERYFREDVLRLWYWCGVAGLLVWLLALAGGDWLASRAYYHGELNRLLAERTSLQADVARLKQEHRERNKPKSDDAETT